MARTTSELEASNHRETRDVFSSTPIELQTVTTVPLHPLRIKPAGNAYTATENIKHALGNLFALPDELLVQILEFLDAASLNQLGCTCKALYAFSRLEDLWKTHCIGREVLTPNNLEPLRPYTFNIPARNSIPRLSNISTSDFRQKWTNVPFILTDPVQEWPIYQQWSTEVMLHKYGEVKFRAEAVDWPLRIYVDYMTANEDESPLYLFDRSFVEKMGIKVGRDGQYWAPDTFGEDLFASLGDRRPDSRWLIVGPERSGSTFHKDPNATSAWNAVIRGQKYWIMFPASPNYPPPPGVFVSADQSEVTSPLSISEWLLGFHAEARATSGCMEGVCKEGEVLHVPSGWWHLVVNLSPSIAITQNFVPETHLASVLDFLKSKPDQVSGFQSDVNDPYELLLQKLRELHSDLLTETVREMEHKNARNKRKWDQLVEGDQQHDRNAETFSFGFGEGGDEAIP